MKQDIFMLGGQEFQSRFILGSGKFRRRRKYFGLYTARRDASAEYFRRQKCTGGRADCQVVAGAGLREFCENRDYAGFQIFAAG